MVIAVTHENGNVFQHFGHSEQFKIYEIENNEIKSSKIVCSLEGGHSALAKLLSDNKVDALICGGIGGGAKNALASLEIKLFGGVSGDCDKAVSDYLSGKLEFNPDVKCNHFDEHHANEAEPHCHDANGCKHHCH